MKWFLIKDEKDKEEVVECQDCKHIIRVGTAQKVVQEQNNRSYSYGTVEPYTYFYCADHKKPYTLIVISYKYCDGTDCPYNTTKNGKPCNSEHQVTAYYKPRSPWQEIDKDGKEIK